MGFPWHHRPSPITKRNPGGGLPGGHHRGKQGPQIEDGSEDGEQEYTSRLAEGRAWCAGLTASRSSVDGNGGASPARSPHYHAMVYRRVQDLQGLVTGLVLVPVGPAYRSRSTAYL